MRKVLLLTMVLLLMFATVAKPNNSPRLELQTLQTEITKLKLTINSLRKIIEQLKRDLEEENEEKCRLLGLCRKAGIKVDVRPLPRQDFEGEIIYRGSTRSKLWFDKRYEQFCGNIVCINGEYFEKSLLGIQNISPNKLWPKGTVVKFPFRCKVLQVLGRGEALVIKKGQTIKRTTFKGKYLGTISRGSDTLFHLRGYEKQLIDEQVLYYEGSLISIGTFEYTDTLEAKRIIQSFRIYKPLTKKQFADCLNSGFHLYQIRNRRGRIERKLIP